MIWANAIFVVQHHCPCYGLAVHPEKGDATISVNPWPGERLLPVAGEKVIALVM